MKSIVVAVDLLPKTSAVLKIAKNFSKAFDAKLFIIHSEYIGTYINSVISDAPNHPYTELINDLKKNIKSQLAEMKKKLLEENIEVESILMDGLTIENILEEANNVNADLIIIGSHKHGKLYHFLFGSIHNALINKSTVPIMIIPNNYKE